MNSCERPIYLNNAATSWPKPECVAEAVAGAIQRLPGAAGRGGIADFDVFEAVREELLGFMGVSRPEQIALGCNSTWGLNQAIFGYPLKAGDTVLTTTAEHNAVLRPLYRLEQQGIRVVYLSSASWGKIRPESFREALVRYRPRLCVLNHASNVTGAVQDAGTLTGLAKEYGAEVLLDLSQSLGWIEAEVERWGADMAVFTGHKYLLGPQGTGGLYVRPGLLLKPWMLGGTGVQSDLPEMPPKMPLHLEAGTGNEPSYHGLLAALRWSRENPPDQRKTEELREFLRKGLKKLGCLVAEPEGRTTPVLSFVIPGISSEEAGEILTGSYDIVCRTGLHCAPRLLEELGMPGGNIRFSLSRFTSEEEVRTALDAVKTIVESGL